MGTSSQEACSIIFPVKEYCRILILILFRSTQAGQYLHVQYFLFFDRLDCDSARLRLTSVSHVPLLLSFLLIYPSHDLQEI